jgi:colicin import membrane protein
MAEQKESSVLFSLKELMNLEEDRIRQEEDAKRRQEEEAARVRAEAERRAREEEEARMRAVEEKRRTEEQRTREDAARLEAIRHAEVEKARLDAENQARMQQLTHQQEHERQLALVSQDKSKKRLVLIAVTIGVLAVGGLAGGAFVISNQLKKSKDLEAQLTALQSQADENNRKMSELNGKLASATTPEEKAELERQLDDAKKKQTELQQATQSVKTGGGPRTFTGPTQQAPRTLPKCHCSAGDPLCSEIPGQTCTP